MNSADRSSSVSIGRDALGNVFVTGDGNTVEVVLTVVAADPRLQDAPAALDNPYRGLDAFRETDSAVFFGREDLIARLWTRFQRVHDGPGPRLLPILGASGSGKSSLVRAGLLPELVRQPIAGMRSPSVLMLRPGANPLRRLADVLARIAPGDRGVEADCLATSPAAVGAVHRAALAGREAGARVVLFVDQLEELFTECAPEPMCAAFLAKLAYAAAQPDGVVSTIFAIRNDFAGALRRHDAFALAVREQRIMVPPLSRHQLLDAIERPAAALGHPWPGGLVESLVLQCEGRAGALPLLQFALTRLWPEHLASRLAEQRWSSRLIEDFVVQAADALFDTAGTGATRRIRQRIIRRAFLAMVQLGEGAADTRRVARLSEIARRGETTEQVRDALAPFAAPDARLLTASEIDGEPSYELVHEVLIGSWDRLRGWLGNVPATADAEAIREELRLRRRFAVAAATWRGAPDALLRPPDLGLVTALRDRDPDELSALETEFVEASLAAWNRSAGWRRRALRAIGALSAALAVFSIGLSFVGFLAWRRTRETHRLLGTTYLERGGALVMDDHPMQALPYLVAARTEGIQGPGIRVLFTQATRDVPLTTIVGHNLAVTAAVFDLDGKRVATASEDGTARVWDATTGSPVTGPLEHGNTVRTAAFSPDGRWIVTASDDHTARVWNAATGVLVAGPLHHGGRVTTVAFSPNGRRVVTASKDKAARVWDIRTGRLVTGPLEHGGAVTHAAFSPDGRWIVTASEDHTARIWDAATGAQVAELPHERRVNAAVFSPDGTWVATASEDNTARMWDAKTGQPGPGPLEHDGAVTAVVFAPGGDRLMTVSRRTAQFWKTASGEPLRGKLEHHNDIRAAAFSRDGAWIVTASEDNTARVWDAATLAPVTGPLEHQGVVRAAAFSADGRRIVTASEDNTARIWDAGTADPMIDPLPHLDAAQTAASTSVTSMPLLTVAVSADGTRAVTVGDKTARVWDTMTGKQGRSLVHTADVRRAAFSPDGAWLVTMSSDHTARVWDVTTGHPIAGPLLHRDDIAAAVFSPDGLSIVTASKDKTARVWDIRTSRPVTGPLEHERPVTQAAFSPDGKWVATASDDSTARVWDAATGKPVGRPLRHRGDVWRAVFSPDGRRVVTASEDNTAQVWDAATGQKLIAPLAHHGTVSSAAFSPDGARVVTGSYDRTARVWDATTGQAITGPLEHRDVVKIAVFNTDGTLVVTGSEDGTVRVWDAATGQPVTRPLAAGGPVQIAMLSPDGTRVMALTSMQAERMTVRMWPLTMDTGLLDDWKHLAACSAFALDGAALIANPAPRPTCETAVKRARSRRDAR